MENVLEVMPAGYSLQARDECGVSERQPHVTQKASLILQPSELMVDADVRDRSVVWDREAVTASYEGLDGKLPYVLAVTYVTDQRHNRVQSLWSGELQVHGPYALHKGRAERLLVRVPPNAVRNGTLDLQFRREAEGDAVLGSVELWAPLPPPKTVRILQLETLFSDLRGQVTDVCFQKLVGAEVELFGSGGARAATRTDAEGWFCFARETVQKLAAGRGLRITAAWRDCRESVDLSPEDLSFSPVRFRPIPAAVDGLASPRLSLNGPWRVNPAPTEHVREESVSSWKTFQVPGQFAQHGIDVPDDRPVAVAREFEIPAEWAGHRIFLRFDAIHGGTRYWLNGRPLGESENLFTPVEWEITECARAGATNRLDLLMKVMTTSEQLSYSSGYVFHSLGGIDRKVQLYALPKVCVRDLRIRTDLDAEYRDARLNLACTVENPGQSPLAGLSLHLSLVGPSGDPVANSVPETRFSAPASLSITTEVANPLKWSAEKPSLYRLAIELQQNGTVLERIEREIGFRSVEIRDSQLYLNGRRIKLAGALRHENHPLTGRADTARWAQTDITLLKRANLNYVRTIHYPPTEELLENADRQGVYVECEAPFCWVGISAGAKELDSPLREVLTPVSAMVDFCHAHPSVISWSLANESKFQEFFRVANRLCKELDPTRPTTFNGGDPEGVCDLANLHYPPMPYDEQLKDDPRPILIDEYFFPLCHGQTDMDIDPGLRELWGHGHADPDSPWGRYCAKSFEDRSWLHPGALPGTWDHIVRSGRVVGAAICALVDEPFYLPRGRKAGYAFVHGFWGLVDGWRRPKPEWELCRLIFSPVWFPKREVSLTPGQTSVRIPVRNRYSFTDLRELTMSWQLGDRTGTVKAEVPPGSSGALEVPVAEGTPSGSRLMVRVLDANGDLVTETSFTLGKPPSVVLRRPGSGCPSWKEEAGLIVVEGRGYSLVFDRATMRAVCSDPRHQAGVIAFPHVHLTRIDIAVLSEPRAAPYAVFPDLNTRRIEEVSVREQPSGLEITVRDSYDILSGSISWVIDAGGMGRVCSQYRFTGPDLNAREVGIRFRLDPRYDRLAWRRWSEWGESFPADSVCRIEGSALARRDAALGPGGPGIPPAWPWALDQNDYGTNDFRGVKFTVYEASLTSSRGAAGGLRIHANADAHVRACIDPKTGETLLHALSECRLGQVVLRRGDVVRGEFLVELLE